MAFIEICPANWCLNAMISRHRTHRVLSYPNKTSIAPIGMEPKNFRLAAEQCNQIGQLMNIMQIRHTGNFRYSIVWGEWTILWKYGLDCVVVHNSSGSRFSSWWRTSLGPLWRLGRSSRFESLRKKTKNFSIAHFAVWKCQSAVGRPVAIPVVCLPSISPVVSAFSPGASVEAL